jgi:hypothetical protein
MALGCQTEASGAVGLWWSTGVRGGGADSCPLLHWVSHVSLFGAPGPIPVTQCCQCCLRTGARPQRNGV